MPVFDYGCDGCGSEFEVLVGGGFEAPTDCPDCARPGLRKLVRFNGMVSRTQFQTPGEQWLAYKHAKDAERAAANGTLQSLKISGRDPGPKPDIPRRLY